MEVILIAILGLSSIIYAGVAVLLYFQEGWDLEEAFLWYKKLMTSVQREHKHIHKIIFERPLHDDALYHMKIINNDGSEYYLYRDKDLDYRYQTSNRSEEINAGDKVYNSKLIDRIVMEKRYFMATSKDLGLRQIIV